MPIKTFIFSFILIVSSMFASEQLSPFEKDLRNNVSQSVNQLKKEQGKTKFSYKQLIDFLKRSNDKNKIMILGILYSNDSDTPDDYGEYIKADPQLAEHYLLQSYRMGNPKALAILGGLILFNDYMAKLDPKLENAEKYLITAYKEGIQESGLILAHLYLVKEEYQKAIQLLLSLANRGDSSAQLQLALIFNKGVVSAKTKKMEIEPDHNLAEQFLNQACHNEKKSDYVREFCYSKFVKTEVKR